MSEEEEEFNEEKENAEEAIAEEGEDDEKREALNEEQEILTPLSKEIIAECISMVSQIGAGLNFAFIKLDCSAREVTDISILNQYVNLRLINISKNLIKDLSPVSSITNLLMLNAEENMMETAEIEPLNYLQHLNLSSNRIRTLRGISHPNLEFLNISSNQIEEVIDHIDGPILSASVLTQLHTLDLHGNRLTSTAGFHLPNLKVLYLASNVITKIEDMENLPSLTTLHLRDNKIESLDGFSASLGALRYINLRANGVVKAREVRKLQCLPALQALTLSENPAADEEDYRMEVLAFLRKLVKLDKDPFEEEEREDAEAVMQQKILEEKEELEAAALLKAEEEEQAAARGEEEGQEEMEAEQDNQNQSANAENEEGAETPDEDQDEDD